MRSTRRLVLRKETLTELRVEELAAVAGGDAGVTLPVRWCVEYVTSALVECDSYLRPCISHTCTR